MKKLHVVFSLCPSNRSVKIFIERSARKFLETSWKADGKESVLSGLESQRARSSRASPQDSWRHLKMALEGPAKCSF